MNSSISGTGVVTTVVAAVVNKERAFYLSVQDPGLFF